MKEAQQTNILPTIPSSLKKSFFLRFYYLNLFMTVKDILEVLYMYLSFIEMTIKSLFNEETISTCVFVITCGAVTYSSGCEF